MSETAPENSVSATAPTQPSASSWAKELCLMIIGGWIFATVFMFFVANGNFTTLRHENLPKDRVELAFASMPVKNRPMALKYCANELNRNLFTYYGYAQLVPAVLCLLLALTAGTSRTVTIMLGASLAVVLVNMLVITPQIIHYGEIIEFLPRNPIPEAHKADLKNFGMYHGVSFLTYFVQLGCLVTASMFTIFEKKQN